MCIDGRRPLLANVAAHDVLRQVWEASHERYGWAVGRYVIMPEHVHLFARASTEARALREWMRLWESFSARSIRGVIGGAGPLWQRDYFDRFLRSGESYSEKWSYVRENPVRAGLVTRAEDWPYAGELVSLRF